MTCLDTDFFAFILFEIHPASWICNFTSFAKFGKFRIFLQILFWSRSLLSIGDYVGNMLVNSYCPAGLWDLIFFSLFSLLLTLGKVYWFILKFTNCPSHLHFTIGSIQHFLLTSVIFISSTIFLVLFLIIYISFWNFWIFLFIAREFVRAY